MDGSDSPRRVELFVRSLAPEAGGTRTHHERLRELAGEGPIEQFSVCVWGDEVALSTTASRAEVGTSVLRRVASFREWAASEGVSVDPFFEVRETQSSITGEEYASLLLPAYCLAEYQEGELVHVAPYAADGAVCSVPDRIRRLEAAARPGVGLADGALDGLTAGTGGGDADRVRQ